MNKLKFKIEQVALYPKDPEAAKALLSAIGGGEWAEDHVVALGEVFGIDEQNEANLNFEYDLLDTPASELEVLQYTQGDNWMDGRIAYPHRVSHLGMHCSAEDLERWRDFFNERGIDVAQEVNTISHTNPHIAGKRWYNYVIFDTYEILGVDLKFIVRYDECQVRDDG